MCVGMCIWSCIRVYFFPLLGCKLFKDNIHIVFPYPEAGMLLVISKYFQLIDLQIK